MRIAINTLASQGRHFGGARYVRNLVKTLAKVDPKNEYVLYVSADESAVFSSLGPNFQLVPSPASRPLRILWEQTGLPLDLKRRGVDIFHGPSFVTPLAKTCRRIVTIYDMTFFLLPKTARFHEASLFQSLHPRKSTPRRLRAFDIGEHEEGHCRNPGYISR
jgi:hypothetical protein